MQSGSKLPHSIETCRLSLKCGDLLPLLHNAGNVTNSKPARKRQDIHEVFWPFPGAPEGGFAASSAVLPV
jgi:hypothetical protein